MSRGPRDRILFTITEYVEHPSRYLTQIPRCPGGERAHRRRNVVRVAPQVKEGRQRTVPWSVPTELGQFYLALGGEILSGYDERTGYPFERNSPSDRALQIAEASDAVA